MKKKIGVTFVVLFVVIFTVVFSIMWAYERDMTKKQWKGVKWEESFDELENPDRGFYVQTYTSDDYTRDVDYEPYLRVRLLTMNLYSYQDMEFLPDEKLLELRETLDAYRAQGVSVVFRAGYFFGEQKYTEPESFSIIESHCRQICPILNEYSDIVQVVQAGFLGPYGEWHSSKYITVDDKNDENYEIQLVKILTEELEEEITVALRRPMYIRSAVDNGIDVMRLSYHNDAFLSTDTDMGTYVEKGYTREAELQWIQENLINGFNGGEMTNLSEYTNIEQAIKEMEQLDFSYLNRYYNTEVLNEWKEVTYDGQNAFQYVRDHLGYRLYISELFFLEKVTPKLDLEVKGTICNTGFASVPKEYQLYFVVKANQNIVYLPVEIQKQSEDEISFSVSADIWEMFENEEEIQVGLSMSKSIEQKKAGICFANIETEFIDGVNWLFFYHKATDEKWEKTECYFLDEITKGVFDGFN